MQPSRQFDSDKWRLLDAELPASEVPDAFERERLLDEAYAAPRRRLSLGRKCYQATSQTAAV